MDFLKHLFGGVPSVGPEEAQQRLKAPKPPVLVDVRQPDEYRAGHIAGARLIPLGELSQRLAEIPKEREVLCVCRSGSRSGSAVRQLIAAGYTATNLSGGMLGWTDARLPIKTGK